MTQEIRKAIVPSATFDFVKSDQTGGYVRGWASVVSIAGVPVVDYEGDHIEMDELRKAAHQFVTEVRVAKVMHKGQAVGEVIESVIVDDEFAKAIGASAPQRGWWIGMRIDDDNVRKQIRSGKFRAFSVGGKGNRVKVE